MTSESGNSYDLRIAGNSYDLQNGPRLKPKKRVAFMTSEAGNVYDITSGALMTSKAGHANDLKRESRQ